MPVSESRLLFRNDASTPLGRLTAAGFIREGSGVRGPQPRVLGSYAIVYLLEGSGRYHDVARRDLAVRAGDLLVLFPEIGHQYGPGAGEHWSEFYLVFDGPAFDLWRSAGLLNPSEPLIHLEPIDRWLARLEGAVRQQQPPTLAGRMQELTRFLTLLTEILTPVAGLPGDAPPADWLARACAILETNLDQQIDPASVAAAVGLAYETFRKRFQQQIGVSPARYRAIRRIDAACAMLHERGRTIAAIALSLGFSDEYHFSRRFKQITGVGPREFRRRLPSS
jgi:AraC-like DNA-binding protein